MNYVNHTIHAGGYDKHTYSIDSRTGTITARLRHHRRSVLCLAADENYVITGSEDKTLCIYDKRAAKVLKIIPVRTRFVPILFNLFPSLSHLQMRVLSFSHELPVTQA